jgi:hypothetical protein
LLDDSLDLPVAAALMVELHLLGERQADRLSLFHVAFCHRRQSRRSLGWDRGGEPWPTTDCTEGTTDGSQAKGDNIHNIPGIYPAFIALAATITTYKGLDVGIDSAQEVFDRMAMR